MMKREDFADEIKTFLRKNKIKQKDIADKFGVHHATVNNLINGHTRFGTANKNLKRIAEDLGLPPITTYTARYTWATLAASIDTPIEVISQALGHTYGQAVTLGYIMPDRRKVDEANKAVLALLPGTDAAK